MVGCYFFRIAVWFGDLVVRLPNPISHPTGNWQDPIMATDNLWAQSQSWSVIVGCCTLLGQTLWQTIGSHSRCRNMPDAIAMPWNLQLMILMVKRLSLLVQKEKMRSRQLQRFIQWWETSVPTTCSNSSTPCQLVWLQSLTNTWRVAHAMMFCCLARSMTSDLRNSAGQPWKKSLTAKSIETVGFRGFLVSKKNAFVGSCRKVRWKPLGGPLQRIWLRVQVLQSLLQQVRRVMRQPPREDAWRGGMIRTLDSRCTRDCQEDQVCCLIGMMQDARCKMKLPVAWCQLTNASCLTNAWWNVCERNNAKFQLLKIVWTIIFFESSLTFFWNIFSRNCLLHASPVHFCWVFLRLLTSLEPTAFDCRTLCGKSRPAMPSVSHTSVSCQIINWQQWTVNYQQLSKHFGSTESASGTCQLFWMALAVESTPWKHRIKDEIQSLYEEWLSAKSILNMMVSFEGSLNLQIVPCQEISVNKKCMAPMIASLELPTEMSEVRVELARMYEVLAGVDPWIWWMPILKLGRFFCWVACCPAFLSTFYTSLSVCSQDSARAENWASLKMQAIELSVKPNVVGMSLIHQWRWDSGSLWKLGTKVILWFCSKVLEYKLGFEGLKQSSAWNVLRSGNSAEARNIIGVANSILASGYKLEETICSRDAKWGMNVLRFGDGMKRGLAVKLLCLSLIVFLHCFELHSHVPPLSLIKLQGGFCFEKQRLVMDISKKILMHLLYLSHWLGCPPSMRLTSTWLSKQCVKMWKGHMSNPFRAFSGLI